MANRAKFTPKKRAQFVAALAAGDTVISASKRCAVSARTAYDHRNADPAFAAEWDEALEAGTQVMEQEAFRRAVHGVEKPIASAGKIVGTAQEYSDTLLIFMLKARRPSVYRDTINVEHYIRQAAMEAGVDPDVAVAEANAILKEARKK